jgi:uncharacterized membrane protein
MLTSQKIFVALLVVAVGQTAIYYSQMPEVLASHFDGAGRPNGHMTRGVFFAIHLGIMAILAVSFLLLPGRLRFFSYRSWSIPNKEYWLAPERREETLLHVQDQTIWCGVVTAAFLILVIQLAIEANLNPPPRLSSAIGWLLVGYFIYIGFWVYRLFRRYLRVPEH